ncbi:hypothetical protein J4457_05250 [Candidatus Woesearchaeota archaeon]|nr:hypothetical protein [Candidatus Woesearchaeota archaeon]
MKTTHALVLGYIFFAVAFFLFYPQAHLVSDEAEYSRTAYFLQEGRVTVDNVTEAYNFNTDGKSYFAQYPVGTALLLYPLIAMDYRAQFLLGFILHSLLFLFAILILKKLKISPYYAFLYLFHPTLIYYSQRLYSDLPSAFFIVAGAYFLFFRSIPFLAGLLLGFSVLIRYTNLIFIAPFVFGYLFYLWKEHRYQWNALIKPIFSLLPGFALFGVFILWFNHKVYGAWHLTGYSFSIQHFSFSFLGVTLHLIVFILALTFFYPFLSFALFRKQYLKELVCFQLSVFLGILFYSFMQYSPSFQEMFSALFFVNLRFLVPLLPFMIILYAAWISRWNLSKLGIAVIVCLAIFSLFVLHLGYESSDRNFRIMTDLHANTEEESFITGFTLSQFFHESFGKRYFLSPNPKYVSGDQDYLEQSKDADYLILTFSADEENKYFNLLQSLLEERNGTLVYNNTYVTESIVPVSAPLRIELYDLS